MRLTFRVSHGYFISSTLIQGELRQNQVISVKEKASLLAIYSNSDQDSTRGKNLASTAITTTSTTVIVNTNIQPQVQ